MKTLNRYTVIFLIALLSGIKFIASAQETSNVKFGKISPEDFDLKGADTTNGAIIIADIGSTSFTGNAKGWFSHVFKRYTRIKILNQSAFEAATQQLFLYRNDDDKEQLSDIAATTYTLDNGRVIQTNLDKKDIFEDRYNKNYTEKKFALPAVKPGSIIEYTYTITSDFDFRLHDWEFQSTQYPCLWSEYSVSIPSLLIYTFVHQGFDSFYVNKAWTKPETFSVSHIVSKEAYGGQEERLNVNTYTNNRRWVMKDLKPLKAESYVSSERNYIDKIEFQLSQVYDGETTKDVMSDWGKASQELLSREDFGLAFTEDASWMQDKVKEISNSNPDAIQFAQSAYNYIRDNFNCTNYNNFYIKSSLQNVFKSHSGNVGELNLLLVLMLRQRGLAADPVLLSTRENGFNFPSYPILDKFNYLICQMKSGDNVYYLDCSHKLLAFGLLAGNCYNGNARVVNTLNPGALNFSADSLKEQKLVLINISNSDNGNLAGTVKQTPGMSESYDIRGALAASQGGDPLKLLKNYCPVDIPATNLTVDSLKNFASPVTINYDVKFSPNGADVFYFNPLIFHIVPKNPFTSDTRTYPVEIPYCIQDVYILNMDVPDGYRVDELPKSIRLRLGDTDGQFEYIAAADKNHIQLRCKLTINKANFDAADYEYLRNFFSAVVKKQSEQIVFKKL